MYLPFRSIIHDNSVKLKCLTLASICSEFEFEGLLGSQRTIGRLLTHLESFSLTVKVRSTPPNIGNVRLVQF